MKLKEISSLLFIDSATPAPLIISNEYKLNLLYFYEKDIEGSTIGYQDIPQQRDLNIDTGIGNICFKVPLLYKFGYPNEEVISSHPLFSLGLELYKFYEVEQSNWIDSVKEANKVHTGSLPPHYNQVKHYIITFKDSTFECIALSVDITFQRKSMKDELITLIDMYT